MKNNLFYYFANGKLKHFHGLGALKNHILAIRNEYIRNEYKNTSEDEFNIFIDSLKITRHDCISKQSFNVNLKLNKELRSIDINNLQGITRVRYENVWKYLEEPI